MSEAKHTPTPWDVNTLAGTPHREVFYADVLICDTGCGPTITEDEIQGNAEFIVQACNAFDDMLAALKLCTCLFPATCKVTGDCPRCAAIAKAEGKS